MKREKKIHKKILTYQNTYTVHFDIINSFYAIFIGIYLPSLPLPSFAIEIRRVEWGVKWRSLEFILSPDLLRNSLTFTRNRHPWSTIASLLSPPSSIPAIFAHPPADRRFHGHSYDDDEF